MPKTGMPTVESEKQAMDTYISDKGVEAAIQDIVQSLIAAKPENPRLWLLQALEKESSNESQDLSETELQLLFSATRKITSEIVPKDAIDSIIRETLSLLNCDRVSLFNLDRKMDQLRLYASNLEHPIMVKRGQGIVGNVFQTCDTVNIPDCYSCPHFEKSIDQQTGYVTRSLIAVPIIDFEGECVGVIQAINKLPSEPPPGHVGEPVGAIALPFERNDEKILQHLTQHVGIAMRNADLFREAIATSERSTGLLNTIQSLSQDLGTQSMLLTITMHANKIVSCERATVFLVDSGAQQLWSVSTDTGQEIRIPKTAGIAGLCCTEAKVINIPDAYADSRFNQEVDKRTGFKTQSILAVPMLEDDLTRAAELTSTVRARKSPSSGAQEAQEWEVNGAQAVVGVIQMINKVSYDGQLEIFDESDVEVMELFAKFVAPKLALDSMVTRRQSEHSELTEGEVAWGMLPETPHGSHKRHSHVNLISLGEGEENEDS